MKVLFVFAAVFFVLVAEAFAALPRNSVGSAQVKPDSLRGADIDESTLGAVPRASTLQGKAASDFQLRVNGTCPDGEAIFAVNADGTVQCLPVGASGLADVAFSGDYADLLGAPSLATVAVTGAYSDLTGRPALATVATTGAYADLTGRPSLAAVATTGSWDDLTGVPADLADGDDGQAYTAGAGLSLTGSEFAIAGGGVQSSMLAPGAVAGGLGGKLQDESVDQNDIKDGTVGSFELAFGAVVGGFGGDVQDNSINADDIGPDSIGASELANSAVVGGLGGDLQDNTVGADDLGPSAVQASELADNAVDVAAMLDNSVGLSEMQDDAIGNAEMRDNAIQSAELANGAVVGGIGGDILDNSISAADLAQDTWNLTGNTGINPGNQFLGTTDAQPLQLRTSNVNRLVISAAGAIDVSGSLAVGGALTIGGGTSITAHRSATAVLDFNLLPQDCHDLAVTVTGAALGDTVAVGPPGLEAGVSVTGFVQSSNSVAVRMCNVTAGAINPTAGTYRVDVWAH